MQTHVLGLSVDSVPCLKAWADSLGGITYPLLSDFFPHGGVAKKYQVLRADGKSERAIFVLDKEGIVRHAHVHDIDVQPDNDELMATLCAIDPLAAQWAQENPPPEGSLTEPEDDVVMYCTDWCPGCRRARLYFKANAIPFVELDITHDRAAAARVRGWAGGNETTPTFKIHGQVLVGYDERKVAAALGFE